MHQNRGFIRQEARAGDGTVFPSHKVCSSSKGRWTCVLVVAARGCWGCALLWRWVLVLLTLPFSGMLGRHLGPPELKIFNNHVVRTEILNHVTSGSSTAVDLGKSILRAGLHHVPSPEQLMREGTKLEMRNGLDLSTLITVLKKGLFLGLTSPKFPYPRLRALGALLVSGKRPSGYDSDLSWTSSGSESQL